MVSHEARQQKSRTRRLLIHSDYSLIFREAENTGFLLQLGGVNHHVRSALAYGALGYLLDLRGLEAAPNLVLDGFRWRLTCHQFQFSFRHALDYIQYRRDSLTLESRIPR